MAGCCRGRHGEKKSTNRLSVGTTTGGLSVGTISGGLSGDITVDGCHSQNDIKTKL